MNTIITTLLIIVAVVALALCLYIYLRDKSLNDIRADVYQLFLAAEHTYTKSGEGKKKMRWVLSRARSLLPDWLQLFITEEFLEKVIEDWFRAIKDLLDDGKYNRSARLRKDERNED